MSDTTIRPDDTARDEPTGKHAELLREFAACLSEAADSSVFPADGADSPVGLYQVFEILASQRQELKLHTKTGRQTQELLHGNIEALSGAVEALNRYRKERPHVERKAALPLLTSLVELDESLHRAGTALDSLRTRLLHLLRERDEAATYEYCDNMSWWERFRKRKIIRRFAEHMDRDRTAELTLALEPFREGLDMLRSRMEDVLKRHAVRRLNPVGEPVDPETMQVVGVVDSDDIPSGRVVDVVRFGYSWHDKPLRFADVRAAR